MKVVINTCFGGFGLSEQAIRTLYARKSKFVKAMEPKEYYGGYDGWEEKFASDQLSSNTLMPLIVVDGKIIVDNHRNDDSGREDKKLIKVIEEFGAAICSGRFAQLKVVEIPDGTDYTIEEYDGSEHIAEVHSTWR